MKRILITLFLLAALPAISGNVHVYFTDPGRKIRQDNPAAALIQMIRKTRNTFFGAFYDISSTEISDELIRAHRRGVDVRLVTDDKNFSGQAVYKIIEEGIPVVTDNKSGLMHNKFAVSDLKFVFTGSFNATRNGTIKNNNNAVVIKSEKLADIYLQEFQEMFGGHIFSNRKEMGLYAELNKQYYVKLPEADINVYFSPDDDVERIILKRIIKAKKTIRFMYFSYTSPTVADAMISMFRKGIDVKGLLEKRGAGSRYSQYVKMHLEGIPVRLDRNRYIMHHKVIIIDDYRVITGSYNMSGNAAKKNDENIIIIDSRDVAEKFIKEFNRLYGK